mmetsp:Transcript_69224/g.77446  ORF Transcript_69224/g.77446 Transcript_69224/m.77446 type:complete len:104 (-) Transcript_69224:651-962(-)
MIHISYSTLTHFYQGNSFVVPSFDTAMNVPVLSIVIESSSVIIPLQDTSTGIAPHAFIFSIPGPNSVWTKPGAIAITEIPSSFKSQAKLLAIMFTPALLVRYA